MTLVPYGLGPTGFVAKTADEAQAEIQSDLQAAFGASIDVVSPQSALGQLAGIMGQRLGALWSVGQAVYASQDPATATDVGLDGVCAITGTIRDGARRSTATVTCTGSAFTSLKAGRVVSVVGTGVKFTTDADALLVNAPSMNTLTAYAVGVILYLSGGIFVVTVAGITDSILNPFPGPMPSPGDQGTMTGGSPVTVMFLGVGHGYANVPVTAQQSGPFLALAGTLTVIETPVAGWNGAYNTLDAAVGAFEEGDPALRIRREVELEGDADATPNAIRAKVLKVGENTDNPVTACTVFQNSTMTTDANGLPPKSVEVLVQGGDDVAILQTIFDTVAGGIETVGNHSGNVIDDGGNTQLVKFSRANQLLVYITYNLEVDSALFPVTGGITLAALVSLITYPIGKGVAASALIPAAFQVPGVINCPLPFIGLAAAPATTATIVAGSHDRAVFDSSRVVVNVTSHTEGNP